MSESDTSVKVAKGTKKEEKTRVLTVRLGP